MEKYTACICEGGAERAILDLLLDDHRLILMLLPLRKLKCLLFVTKENIKNSKIQVKSPVYIAKIN